VLGHNAALFKLVEHEPADGRQPILVALVLGQ
jgi:hypothetical protein